MSMSIRVSRLQNQSINKAKSPNMKDSHLRNKIEIVSTLSRHENAMMKLNRERRFIIDQISIF